ncbi:MAG: hypothetical protein RIB59_09530 [Rhodospirillales bacterium]
MSGQESGILVINRHTLQKEKQNQRVRKTVSEAGPIAGLAWKLIGRVQGGIRRRVLGLGIGKGYQIMQTDGLYDFERRHPPKPLGQDDDSGLSFLEQDDPLDLGYEQGKIVAYDDDFSLNATILSIGWKDAEAD